MYLIDTNIISELTKKNPNINTMHFIEGLDEIAISSITLDEIVYGVETCKTQNKNLLDNWLKDFFNIPPIVFPIDQEISKLSGQLRAKLSIKGKVRTQADMMIAATALQYKRVLVTRNTNDFKDCGIAILNPFK